MKVFLIAIILGLAIANTMAFDCQAGYTNFKLYSVAGQNAGVNAWAYPTQFGAGSLICEQNNIAFTNIKGSHCTNQNSIPPNSYGFKFTFGFTLTTPGTLEVRVGGDFSLGGAIFVDGNPTVFNNDDLWWSWNYANTNELLKTNSPVNFDAGCHEVVIYGKEYCCDGGAQVQINVNGEGWQVVSQDYLSTLYVPIVQTSVSCAYEWWEFLADGYPWYHRSELDFWCGSYPPVLGNCYDEDLQIALACTETFPFGEGVVLADAFTPQNFIHNRCFLHCQIDEPIVQSSQECVSGHFEYWIFTSFGQPWWHWAELDSSCGPYPANPPTPTQCYDGEGVLSSTCLESYPVSPTLIADEDQSFKDNRCFLKCDD